MTNAQTDKIKRYQEILNALEFPPEAVRLLLSHIHKFCDAHGKKSRYLELITLIEELQRCNEDLQSLNEKSKQVPIK